MSEQPPRDDLLERLRRVESGSPRGEFMTNWHRNPDGPEAADRIERLERALLETRQPARECYGCVNPNNACARCKPRLTALQEPGHG